MNDERSIKINKLLKEKDISYQNIADELGIGITSIGKIINKGVSSRSVRFKVCEMLDQPYKELWGVRKRRYDIGRVMSHEQITTILFKKKISQTKIADGLGVSQSAVSQVISGAQTSIRIQYAICKVIEYPYNDVWAIIN